jgi:hypothetical protein
MSKAPFTDRKHWVDTLVEHSSEKRSAFLSTLNFPYFAKYVASPLRALIHIRNFHIDQRGTVVGRISPFAALGEYRIPSL